MNCAPPTRIRDIDGLDAPARFDGNGRGGRWSRGLHLRRCPCQGYSLAQISLHWIVALLVLAQFLNDEAIGAAWRAIRRGEAAIPGGFLVTAHVVVGIAIPCPDALASPACG